MSVGKNIENLKPFKKGPDPRRNLKGAPPVLPELKELLTKILSEDVTDNISKKKVKALDAVLLTLRNKALKGDMRAIQEILDRFYGKPKQDIGVTGLPPINITGFNYIKPHESDDTPDG